MRASFPLTVLTALDPVLRGTLVSTALCDVPDVVVLQYDIADGSLTRIVHDGAGVHERVVLPPQGCCLNCALHADVPVSLDRLARRLARSRSVQSRSALSRSTPPRIVLAPPTTFEAGPLIGLLRRSVVGGRPLAERVTPDGVLAGIDLVTVVNDLFGDDLLAERDLAIGADDRRAVGEVLAHQVEDATVVATRGTADAAGAAPAVLRHLSDAGAIGDVFDLELGTTLAGAARAAGALTGSADFLDVAPTGAPDAAGVWTRVLESWRPLHPGRLREGISELASGSQRGRGSFWLPTRPSSACRWDAAGGQLSIGTPARWSGGDRRTRLVITGMDVPPEFYADVFDRLLMTDAELVQGHRHSPGQGQGQGLDGWLGVDDGFGPWLGEHDAAA